MTKEKIKCSCCGNERVDTEYYASQSYVHKNTGKLSICKFCVWDYVVTAITEDDDKGYDLGKMRDMLQMLDKPFISFILETSTEEAIRDSKNIFKTYMKNLGLKQNRHLRWRDGDDSLNEINLNKKETELAIENVAPIIIDNSTLELDTRNKEDVLKMLGYDPFESENTSDKRYLYNRLVDFLDESTLEDSFKLPAVIEIVKAFNQIDKINLAISKITANTDSVSNNVGSVNQLITAKEKMLKSVLALAKDNGISVNHNNNKSKGGGTLSGIIKQLQEKGFEEADVNIFDVETSQGMLQVADISNKSIMNQLQFDENDYTNMLMEQRELIESFDKKIINLEEENRKLKKALIKGKNSEEGNNHE